MPKENDLEGIQDRGGKHGGQAGMPKSPPRPSTNDEDVVRKKDDGPKERERPG
ncbi:hypothetical protein GRB70_30125 [Bradyrhizobium neotropicale]|nr:hypothetical protein [Bradyrhizobium neotropicale]